MEAVVFSIFFLKKNKNRFGHPFSGKEPFLLSFTKQLFHPSVEVEAGAELLAATTTSGDSFFSLRSGFSNNITKACHNFWALSWCSDIFTASTFPTDDEVTKQSLITFFPNPRTYSYDTLTAGPARIIFVNNFSPTTLCRGRSSNPRQSVELHRPGPLKDDLPTEPPRLASAKLDKLPL